VTLNTSLVSRVAGSYTRGMITLPNLKSSPVAFILLQR